MRKLPNLGIRAVVALFLAGAAWQVVIPRYHLGAPPLHITCPRGHKAVYGWEKGTSTTGPGEIVYRGWTEWASCSDSLDASTGG